MGRFSRPNSSSAYAVSSSNGSGNVNRVYVNMTPNQQGFFKFLLFVKYQKHQNFVYSSQTNSVFVICNSTRFSLTKLYEEITLECGIPGINNCICNNF